MCKCSPKHHASAVSFVLGIITSMLDGASPSINISTTSFGKRHSLPTSSPPFPMATSPILTSTSDEKHAGLRPSDSASASHPARETAGEEDSKIPSLWRLIPQRSFLIVYACLSLATLLTSLDQVKATHLFFFFSLFDWRS